MCNTRFVSTPPQSPPVIGDAILSAAYDLLCQVGASKLTIQRLADQANVSRMTVYRRFGDLDTVLRKVMTAEIVHAVAEAEAASTDAETARQRIGTAGAQVVSELATHPVFRSILSNDAQAVLPLLTERLGPGQSPPTWPPGWPAWAETVRSERQTPPNLPSCSSWPASRSCFRPNLLAKTSRTLLHIFRP